MRPARRSAVVSGRLAMAANVGTSALTVAADPGDTLWQPLHTRWDNSWPRLASPWAICACAGPIPEATQSVKITSTLVSLILNLIIPARRPRTLAAAPRFPPYATRANHAVALSTVTFAEGALARSKSISALSLSTKPFTAIWRCFDMAHPLSADEHWDCAVGEDLCRYAAEQKTSETAPAMRCHDDQVASIFACGLQDPFARILVLAMHGGAGDAGLARELIDPGQNSGCACVG